MEDGVKSLALDKTSGPNVTEERLKNCAKRNRWIETTLERVSGMTRVNANFWR